MSKKDKISTFFIIVLAIIGIFSPNESIMTISCFGIIVLCLYMQVSNYSLSKKLIQKIEKENIQHIKVKEKNKFMIIAMIIPLFAIYTSIKTKYNMIKLEYNYSYIDIPTFINSLDVNEKLLILMSIFTCLLLITSIIQSLKNTCIISKDKVIFNDCMVFDVDKIEEIQYVDSYIRKNKKIIKISKGFIDRKVVIDIEKLEEAKILLGGENN